MFGENLGTGSLMDTLRDYADYIQDAFERCDYRFAEEYAKSLMQGAMELWQRMVELRGDAE